MPPPFSRALLGFSLAVQLVGLVLSLLVGWQLLLLYLLVMLLVPLVAFGYCLIRLNSHLRQSILDRSPYGLRDAD